MSEQRAMQRLCGLMRKAVQDYEMLAPGDRVMVGVSGGKDSVALTVGLALLRQYIGFDYEVVAVTLDPQFDHQPMDYTALQALFARYGIPYHIRRTEIGPVVFEYRQEKNPCSLCAKLRRGSLNTALTERGIHKIALGHHYDDAVETLLMNLLFEGRLGCFQPVTYLDRTGITQIRPLLYCQEADIRRMAAKLCLPVVKNTCPMDGHSRRQEVKELIASLEERYPDLKKKLFGAVQRYPLYGWDLTKEER